MSSISVLIFYSVIFGFASRDQCDEALENKTPGTCLIRFSESCVEGNHENSKGRIGVVLKTAEGKYQTLSEGMRFREKFPMPTFGTITVP